MVVLTSTLGLALAIMGYNNIIHIMMMYGTDCDFFIIFDIILHAHHAVEE